MKNKSNIIKKYPGATLEWCGDRDHIHGCYIHLFKKQISVDHTEEVTVLIDFDKNNKIIGIDLESG